MTAISPIVTEILSRLPGPQKAAAERCGISAAYLSQIVAGKRQPTLATLEKMAEAAGLEVRLAKRKGAKSSNSEVAK